jgi:ketosteroid isomerase-like protein
MFLADGGKLLKLEFPTTEFQVYGDVAVLYSRYTVDFEIGGNSFTQSGRATEVFRRVKGRWVNTGWHLDRGPAAGP